MDSEFGQREHDAGEDVDDDLNRKRGEYMDGERFLMWQMRYLLVDVAWLA